MLHACQHWSIQNRMQINTEKTKIMAFFETPALLRARWGQHQPSPTMPPFHVYSPFPTSDPRSYPILEVSHFEYLGLILDPKLTMHLTNVEAIRCASQGQALALAVSYSLRYDKNSSQLTPTQNLGLWNSVTSLSSEPALHSQRHRHKKNANQPQSVPDTTPPCIWRPHRTLGRHRNPSPSTHKVRSPRPTTLSTHHD